MNFDFDWSQEQYGTLGDSVTLTCRIESGLEDNSISWDKSGRPVRNDDNQGKYEIRVTDTG